jgi:hypothetical protein
MRRIQQVESYSEMLTYETLTNNAIQEIELIKYLLNKLKYCIYIFGNQSKSNTLNLQNNNEAIYRGYTGGTGTGLQQQKYRNVIN